MVYLLHFHQPLGNLSNPRATARHYIGSASDVVARLAEHQAGRGAAIMAAVAERQINWQLARVWEGGRAEERRIKNYKSARRLCPICRELAGLPPHEWRNR